MFDKRGTGMSDRVAELPGLDARIEDLRAVMDAVGIERAAVMGVSEGGPLAALFAATYPEPYTDNQGNVNIRCFPPGAGARPYAGHPPNRRCDH
jgi:pimeloyl-ACP methyl ester carboxylesterase